MMPLKLSALRDAPPTRAPSMSSQANRPAALSGLTLSCQRAMAAARGQHTAQVLDEMLGLSEAEVAALVASAGEDAR